MSRRSRGMGWDGAVAVVTGASRGIGRAVAHAFAARGARLALLSRNVADLGTVLAETGAKGIAVATDVADRAQVEAAVDRVRDELGEPTVLVNNAGLGAYGAFVDTDPDVFERMMRINYLGTVYATHAVLPAMLRRREGHIVNVASVAGRFGAPFESAYSASKFAVVGLTEALSLELHGSGVNVSLVNPGLVATDFFEARGHPHGHERIRALAPEDIAAAVVRAVERRRSEEFRPRWMRQAYVFKSAVPAAYRAGTRRAFTRELAALRGRTENGRKG